MVGRGEGPKMWPMFLMQAFLPFSLKICLQEGEKFPIVWYVPDFFKILKLLTFQKIGLYNHTSWCSNVVMCQLYLKYFKSQIPDPAGIGRNVNLWLGFSPSHPPQVQLWPTKAPGAGQCLCLLSLRWRFRTFFTLLARLAKNMEKLWRCHTS